MFPADVAFLAPDSPAEELLPDKRPSFVSKSSEFGAYYNWKIKTNELLSSPLCIKLEMFHRWTIEILGLIPENSLNDLDQVMTQYGISEGLR